MAIQPIDLSTMYSQLENVAKFNASQNQMSQVANQLGISKAAQDTLHKSKMVQEAAQDEAEAAIVKRDGNQGAETDGQESSGRGKKKNAQDVPVRRQWEITDPLLGQRIDITR